MNNEAAGLRKAIKKVIKWTFYDRWLKPFYMDLNPSKNNQEFILRYNFKGRIPALTEEEIKTCVTSIKLLIYDMIDDMTDEQILAPWYCERSISLKGETVVIEFGKGGPGSGGGGGCGASGCD